MPNTSKYAEFQIADNSPWAGGLLFMNQYEQKNKLPVPYNTSNKNKPTDFPYSYNNIVSENFFKIIRQLNADFEALESVVYYNGKNFENYCAQSGNSDGRIWGNFYTIIFPEYKLFNWEKSIYTSAISHVTGEKIVTELKELRLDKKLIDRNIDSLQKNNFFILAEKPVVLLCTENAKKEIEESGLTGIQFEEIVAI